MHLLVNKEEQDFFGEKSLNLRARRHQKEEQGRGSEWEGKHEKF